MDQSIYMLNALWFKKDGGRQKYLEYGAAVFPLMKKVGAEIADNYHPEEALIGDWDPDVFFLVKYPNKEAFESMINSAEYREIRHLREASIDKSLLARCKPMDWGKS